MLSARHPHRGRMEQRFRRARRQERAGRPGRRGEEVRAPRRSAEEEQPGGAVHPAHRAARAHRGDQRVQARRGARRALAAHRRSLLAPRRSAGRGKLQDDHPARHTGQGVLRVLGESAPAARDVSGAEDPALRARRPPAGLLLLRHPRSAGEGRQRAGPQDRYGAGRDRRPGHGQARRARQAHRPRAALPAQDRRAPPALRAEGLRPGQRGHGHGALPPDGARAGRLLPARRQRPLPLRRAPRARKRVEGAGDERRRAGRRPHRRGPRRACLGRHRLHPAAASAPGRQEGLLPLPASAAGSAPSRQDRRALAPPPADRRHAGQGGAEEAEVAGAGTAAHLEGRRPGKVLAHQRAADRSAGRRRLRRGRRAGRRLQAVRQAEGEMGAGPGSRRDRGEGDRAVALRAVRPRAGLQERSPRQGPARRQGRCVRRPEGGRREGAPLHRRGRRDRSRPWISPPRSMAPRSTPRR